jgi:hypothetical protein
VGITVKRGFTKAWRKELESDIWLMPPLYHRIWFWIRQKVQHDAYLFPTPKHIGIWVIPGQRLTSLQEIAEGVKWYEWGKEVIPNKKTVKVVLDSLESWGMIETESNAKGTLIMVVNWDSYNNVTKGESNAQVTLNGSRSGHKEECKRSIENDGEKEEEKTLPPSGDGDEEWISKKGRKLTGKHFDSFKIFWDAFDYKKGRAEAIDSWLNISNLSAALVCKIVEAAKVEARGRPEIIRQSRTPIFAQGWLSSRRWEDETQKNTGGIADGFAQSFLGSD